MTKINLMSQTENYEAPALYVVEAQVEAGFAESIVWKPEEEF